MGNVDALTALPHASTATQPARIQWNPITFSTVSWIYPLLKVGYKKPLVEDDLPLLGANEQAANLAHWLDAFTAQSHEASVGVDKKKPKTSLVSALLPHVLPIIAIDAVCQVISVGMTILLSLMIGEVLKFVSPVFPRDQLFIQNGYALALLMLGMQLLSTLSTTVSESIGLVLQIRIKGALVNAIYSKALKLSSKSRQDFPPGKINSLVGSDTTSVMGFIEAMNKVWSMPLQVALAIYFVSSLLGVSTATAGGVFVGLGILSAVLSAPLGKAFGEYMKAMDKRTTVLREFLYGVKVVKYHALEEHSQAKIMSARNEQVKSLYKIILGFVLLIGVLIFQQGLTAPLTFITYGALGHAMTPDVVFPSLSFLSSLIGISGQLPQIVFSVMQALVSYKRLSSFLLAEEANPNDMPTNQPLSSDPSTPAVLLENASFSWEKVEEPKDDKAPPKKASKSANAVAAESVELKKIDGDETASNKDVFSLDGFSLAMQRGSLVAVVGATGSGKSSLLSALAGAMRKTGGDATIYGSVAYCPQEPWIISGTIQENITLLDNSLVDSCEMAVEACSLTKDLSSFPSGIKTQIGEKGINLSGGQKARIALARAIAKNPDIFILDDPLSALDSHVSKDIFDGAINGPLMKPKTVIIATHLLHILPSTDQVIVMDSGKIVQMGTFEELIADVDGKLFETMKDYHLDTETQSVATVVKTGDGVEAKVDKDEDVVAEDRETGAVSAATYKSYAQAIGFTWIALGFVVFCLCITAYVVQQLALSAWTSDSWHVSNPSTTYLYIYSGVTALGSLMDCTQLTVALYLCVRASISFHDRALSGLVRAPMSFFDTQPIGRILNRMTADVRSLDNGTGMIFTNLFANLYICVGILILTCISSWQVIPICAGIVVAVYFIFRFFRNSYRELRRLTSIMQSPLTAHVSETLTGIPTILAYHSESVFTEKQLLKLDQANLSNLLFQNTMFWITMRLNLLGALVTFAVALFGVLGVMPANLVGVALTQITFFAPTVNAVLLLFANLEANMVSVERLNHYANNLPSEANRTLPKDGTLTNWPTAGNISIHSLTLAYESRPDHSVVDGISLEIKAGEKIGVVGRTGSGKSTLMDGFFRILEASKGSISIDGQDIATVGLKKLRSSIQMIPQNPTLFDGTVRSNIDALGKYQDDDIWYALECVGMKEYVSGLSEKLDSPITEGGTNLSAGQRQLLCLAKVLLEKSKILIMDEATSSVDAESDKRIQESMKTLFKSATVLSVAHRLNTIAAFDKVLVLQNGKVAEFDAPHVLLNTRHSIFGEMVDATGVANASVIREIAKEQYSMMNRT
ncbi:Multidrug resistance-associated protein 1 [Podochytrium sp. JEL0797]|nr:Multidrug resistance-associated protein 1 [Podochytrium sp. JEL0797]